MEAPLAFLLVLTGKRQFLSFKLEMQEQWVVILLPQEEILSEKETDLGDIT